ncbi:MAG: alpha/beta fold hydrolase, partial [Anaerolineales bacterium]
MTVIQINNTSLYYEIFGEQAPGHIPIVLIHGFPSTGKNDWGDVAPLLARQYTTIVPDCRGHGQSQNPEHTYSFGEMAADIVALVRGLGYERAHIIGHSNGGNIALVATLEHPEIVQSAVLQAANAYVSPDLIQNEPLVLNPERVLRENPALVEQMNKLHAPTHGPDYWRELLLLGVAEITSQPNYTPQELAEVRRPVLVIQGELDRVNAPSRHAQFISECIPDAEIWIPPGVGHTVHQERLFEWVERILDFLQRRGSPLKDALYRLKQHSYNDPRQTIFELSAAQPENAGRTEKTLVSGQVLYQQQLQVVEDLLSGYQPQGNLSIERNIEVLLDQSTPWALVNRAVIDVRREPNSLAERLTQALLGESLRILEERQDWARVRLEQDGYLGWVQTTSLHHASGEQTQEYQQSRDCLVVAELGRAVSSPGESSPSDRAGVLPFGITIPAVERDGRQAAVRLPDGRIWWVDSTALIPLSERPEPDAEGIISTLQLMRR